MRISDWSSDVCSSDLSGRLTTPWMRCRVVCGLCETMLTLRPTSAFINELLPTLGRPTMEMRPLCTKYPRLLPPRPNVGNQRRVFRSASALRLRGRPTDNGDEQARHEESSVTHAAPHRPRTEHGRRGKNG